MSFFQILQVSIEDQIKTLEDNKFLIVFPNDRFLQFTDEDIRIFYKSITPQKLELLKNYPALVTIERFAKEILLAQIISIEYNEKNKDLSVTYSKISSIEIKQREDLVYENREQYRNEINQYENYLSVIRETLQFEKLEEYRHHWAVKKGNIFQSGTKFPLNFISEHVNLFPNLNKPLPLPQIIAPNSITPSLGYLSVDLTIDPLSKVAEYISEVIKLTNELSTNNNEIFYRGHSNADAYFLQPSLFRQYKDKGPIYLKSEHNSYRELLTIEPKSFATDSSCFEVLTRMQHYSLPTRLLDISSNPLTALYFSCEGNDNIDGEVILFSVNKSNINYYDSDKVSCLTNLAKLNEKQKEDLKNLIEKVKNDPSNISTLDESIYRSIEKQDKVYSQFIHYIKQEKSYFEPRVEIDDLEKILCVKGRLNQDRIIAQSGSFLLFGLTEKLNDDGDDIYTIKRITIKADKKSRILKELDLLKINSRTVYPSIENSSKYLKQKLENESDLK